MVHTHVLNNGAKEVESSLDRILNGGDNEFQTESFLNTVFLGDVVV